MSLYSLIKVLKMVVLLPYFRKSCFREMTCTIQETEDSFQFNTDVRFRLFF